MEPNTDVTSRFYDSISPGSRRRSGAALNPFDEGVQRLANSWEGDLQKERVAQEKLAQKDALARGAAMETAMRSDPLDVEVKSLTQSRTNIGLQRNAEKANLSAFLKGDGADFFEKDPGDLSGKKFVKNPDGTPRLAYKYTDDLLRKRTAAQQTGPDAMRARSEIATTEKEFRLKKEKYDRIRGELYRLDSADKQHVQRLGELGRLREQQMFGAPPSAQIESVSAPEDASQPFAPDAMPEASPLAGYGGQSTSEQGATPLALVKMHAQIRKADAAGDISAGEALRAQLETGLAQIDDAGKQRVIAATKDPAFWEDFGKKAIAPTEDGSWEKAPEPAATVPPQQQPAPIQAVPSGQQILSEVGALNKRLSQIESSLSNAGDKMRGPLEQEKAALEKTLGEKQGLIDAIPTGERIKSALGSIVSGLAEIPAGTLDALAITANKLDQVLPSVLQEHKGEKVSDHNWAIAAKAIRDFAQSVAPADPALAEEFWTSQVTQGIGSMFGFLAGGMAGRAVKASATMTTMVLGAAVGGASGYQDAIANGATEDQAWDSFLLNAGVGTTEIVPISRMFDRIDKATNGKAKKVLLNAGIEGFEEFAQEWFQSTAGNAIAQSIYDKERDLFEGAASSGAAGGVSGVLMSLVASALPGRKHGGPATSGVQPTPTPPVTPVTPSSGTTPPVSGSPVPVQPQPTKGGETNGEEVQGEGPKVTPPTAPPAGEAVNPPVAPITPPVGVIEPTKPEADVTLDDQAPKTFEFTNAKGETATVEATRESQAIAKLPKDFGPVKGMKRIERPADKIAGEPINKEWSAFSPESQSLGVPRAEMPQVKAENRGALTQFLKARDITSEESEVLPTELKPTQAEYSPAKVQKAREFTGGNRAILVSSDNYVVDGHHQWMAKLTDSPDQYMRVIKLDAPIAELLPQMREFPSVKQAAGATKPAATPITQEPAPVPAGSAPNPRSGIEATPVPAPALPQPTAASDKPQKLPAQTPAPAPAPALPLPDLPTWRGQGHNVTRSGKDSYFVDSAGHRTLWPGVTSKRRVIDLQYSHEQLKRGQITPEEQSKTMAAIRTNPMYGQAEGGPIAAIPKPPVIARGANKPQVFIQAVSKAAGLKQKDKATRFLTDFVPKLHNANKNEFRNMEVHVLNQGEWDAHPRTGATTPDSAAAYNPEDNTLYLNSDKIRGNDGVDAVSAIVHEAGHFAEKFALGETLTQREWEKLTHSQRANAMREYDNSFPIDDDVEALKTNRRARSEWVAMQFARVVRGDTDQMPKTIVQRMTAYLEMVRDLVRKWVGAKSLTTKELDSWILDKMGYATREEQRTEIGKTKDGKPLFEDANGVRSYDEGNFTITEAVALRPTRDGIQTSVASDRKGSSWESQDEIKAREPKPTPAPPKVEAPAPKPDTKPETKSGATAPLPDGWKESDIREILARVEEGEKILLGGNEIGMPDIQSVQGARHVGMGMFEAKTPDYEVHFDGGGAMEKTTASGRGFTKVSEARGSFPYDFAVIKAKLRSYLTTPAAAAKPKSPLPNRDSVLPVQKPGKFDENLKQQARDALSDLLGTPPAEDYEVAIPSDRTAKMIPIAQQMHAAGINTSRALAEFIDETFGEKGRKLSQSLWNLLSFSDPKLTGRQDWSEAYAAIDKPAPKADIAPTPNETGNDKTGGINPERDQGDGAAGPPTGGERGNRDQPPGNAPDGGVLEGVSPENVETPSGGEPGRPPVPGKPDVGVGEQTGDVGGGEKPIPDIRGGDGGTVSGDVSDGAGGRGRKRGARGNAAGPDVAAEPSGPERANYQITDPEALVGGGPKTRFEKNRRSIETYLDLMAANRQPSAVELDTLAAYTGWGSFGQELFQGSWDHAQPNAGWETQDQWLRDHMGREEWESAQRSIINAHYTDPITVQTMWGMVRKMGFEGGRVLEPGLGIGNFFGLMPAELAAKSQLTGIELDRLTGGMAKLLYPNANIQIKGYQDSKTSDNFYDLTIGNWPFANVMPADPRYDKFAAGLHDYFFLKALDQTRPGGVVIGITSNSTMDKKGQQVRMALARKGELIAAYRLPAGAFQQYAGTKVVTDILIFKKRAEPISVDAAAGAGWIATGDVDTPAGQKIEVNEYWANNPKNILGKLNWGHGTTTGRPGMIVERPGGYETLLRGLADRVPAGVFTPWNSGALRTVRYVGNQTAARQHSVVEKGGKFYQVQGEHLALLDDIQKWSVKSARETAGRAAELKSLVSLRDGLTKLLYDQSVSTDDLSAQRAKLKTEYDKFVAKHGPLQESKMLDVMLRAGDIGARLLKNIEEENAAGKWVPRSILTSDIVRRAPRMEKLTIEDAYAVDRYQNLHIDPKRIAELAKATEEEVIAKLKEGGQMFRTPAGQWEARDQYLAGNVRQKLREAQDAAEQGIDMARNIEALKKVMPKDVPYLSIEPQLGATWVRNSDYKGFIGHLLGLNQAEMEHVTVELRPRGYKVDIARDHFLRKPEATTQWGTKEISWRKLIDAAMNNGVVKITYTDDAGTHTDEKATREANAKIGAIRDEFKAWLWKEPARAIELQNSYNETFNSVVTPDFDGSHLQLTGLALNIGRGPFDFRTHQKNAVWRFIVNGRGVGAHEVGTGKTLTMAGLAMESRRLGLFRKPLIFAHNANSSSVAADIQLAYPGAKVLYVDNLAPAVRDAAMQQIALDDWDVVVMPHSLLDRVILREETMMAQARELIAELEHEAIEAAAEDNVTITVADMDSGDYKKKLARTGATAKELVKQRERIIERIKKQAQKAKDDSVFFEDMGVDAIMVDEAHIFKKIPIASRQRLKGLNKAGSDRSVLLSMMTDYVKGKNGGKGVFLFTGTPITNTVNEAYNMMRYVMDDTMTRDGVKRWDAWFNAFAEAASDVELTAGGIWEPVERLTQFVNVPELARMAAQVFDVVYAKNMPEFDPRATKEGRDEAGNGRPYKQKVDVTVPMSALQKEHLAVLRQRAQEWAAMGGKARVQEMRSGGPRSPIIIEGEGVKSALDYRLMDLTAADDPQSKINKMVKTAMVHHAEHPKSTQMIFMERGYYDTVTRSRKLADGTRQSYKVPAFNLAKDIVAKLIAQGVPREQIAVFPWLSKARRKEAAEAMLRGEIRFAIGGTETMGTGVNAQYELRAMHHLDAPWMPGELEQRNGRGWRQGNRWNTVVEYRYFTEGSHDGRRWQILLTKDKFIRRFVEAVYKKGESGLRIIDGDGADLAEGSSEESGEVEDGDFAESFGAAVGDPRIMQRAKLQRQIEGVERRQTMHIGAQRDAVNEIRNLRAEIGRAEAHVENVKKDVATYAARGDAFSIEIEGKTYMDRKKAEAALLAISEKLAQGTRNEDVKIGNIAGLQIEATRLYGNLSWRVKGETAHNFSGTVASLEAILRGLAREPERIQDEIADRERSLLNLQTLLNTPFPRQAQLDGYRKQLAQIEREMAQAPSAPPSWLRDGAPVGSLVSFNGKSYDVGAQRWDAQNWWLLLHDPEQHDSELIPAPYDQVMDPDGNAIFQPRAFQPPAVSARPAPIVPGAVLVDENGAEWEVIRGPYMQDWVNLVFAKKLATGSQEEIRADRLKPKAVAKPRGPSLTPNGFTLDQVVAVDVADGLWKVDKITPAPDGSDNEAMWAVEVVGYSDPNKREVVRASDLTLPSATALRDSEAAQKAVAEMSERLSVPVRWAQLPVGDQPMRAPRRNRLQRMADQMEAQAERLRDQAEEVQSYDRDAADELAERAIAIDKRLEVVQKALAKEDTEALARAKANNDLLGAPPVRATPTQEAILAKVNGTLEDKRTLVQKFRDYIADLRDYMATELKQKLVDQFASIKRLERATYGAGVNLDASVSAYKATRLTKNLPSVMDYLMKHGTLAYQAGSMVMGGGKGLMQIFKPLIDGGTLRLWEGYATAFRANRLLQEGKETNFGRTLVNGQWTWDMATAQREIDELLALGQQYPEFETVRQEYVAFQKSILDVAEAAGLVNADARALWEKSDYVPFYRIAEEVGDAKGPSKRRGIADQRSGIKKLKGAAAPVAIMENIVRNVESLVDASFKNIAMQRVADLAAGNNDMLVRIPYKQVPFKASVDEVLKVLEDAGVDTSGLTTDEAAEFVKFWRARAPKGKDVVSVMVDGKPIYYRVKDAALLRSVQSMGPRSYSWWMKALMAPKSALTNLVTLDPAFMAANTIRDSFSAWVISDVPIKPGIDSAIGFVKSLRNDPSKLAIMAAGGGSGHYNNLREGAVSDYIRRMTPAARKTFLESIIDTPMKMARAYADFGRATENANRIAIFDSAKKQGATDAEAAYQALDIMDFGLRGDAALLNFFLDTVPFLNARIQGLYRLGRGLREDPRRVATHGAIIIGASLALLASNWDDDRYWELPEWERDVYYHFWIGGQHIRIPKPFEVGQIFSTIPERLFEFMGKTGDGKLLAKRMLTMIADTFAMNPIPQAMKPLAERAMNLNTFTGRPIISLGDEFKQPEKQFNVMTSETLRELAEAMPASAPEWARSPKTLEHFMRGYFGSLGMYALTGADAITRAATGAPEDPEVKAGDWWVMKRFAPSSDLRETKYVEQFYRLHNEITGLVRQIKELQKTSPVEARNMAAENSDLLRAAPRVIGTYDALQAMRKQEKAIYESAETAEEKRRRLSDLAERRNRFTQSTMEASPRAARPIFNPFRN